MAKKIAFLKSVLQECKFRLSFQSPVSSMCHRTGVSFLQPLMLYKIMKPPVFYILCPNTSSVYLNKASLQSLLENMKWKKFYAR